MRHPELDVLRSVAIVLMVIYHLCFDLVTYYHWNLPIFEGWWVIAARAVASLFLLLVGASFVISFERSKEKANRWQKYLKRGFGLIGLGLLISLVTWIADPETYVRFGILHLIGASILLLPLFVRLKELNIFLGTALIALGIVLNTWTTEAILLIPFGIPYAGFHSVDYFPLLPWFGVVLMGAGIGHFVYIRHAKQAPHLSPVPQWLTWPGRHSLMIYLVHQPIIVGVLWVVMGKPML